MASRPATVQQYLDSLAADRREAIEAIRAVIRANLDPLIEEGIQYGMIGYYLPHSVYPAGYHCDPEQPVPFASLASQKNHIGIYLFCIYGDDHEIEQFREEWTATGKRLDMGKACVRVKRLADTPLEVLGRAIKRMTVAKFRARYEATLEQMRSGRGSGVRTDRAKSAPAAKQTTTEKSVAKPATAKKSAAKKAGAKKAAAKKAPARRGTSD